MHREAHDIAVILACGVGFFLMIVFVGYISEHYQRKPKITGADLRKLRKMEELYEDWETSAKKEE